MALVSRTGRNETTICRTHNPERRRCRRRTADREPGQAPDQQAPRHPETTKSPAWAYRRYSAYSCSIRVVAAALIAMLDGTWTRLQACPRDVCGWAFYDRSTNNGAIGARCACAATASRPAGITAAAHAAAERARRGGARARFAAAEREG